MSSVPAPVIVATRLLFDVAAIPAVRTARRLGRETVGGDAVLVPQGVERFVLRTGIGPGDALLAEADAVAPA